MRLGSTAMAAVGILFLAACGSTGSAPAAGGNPGTQVQVDAQNTQFTPATIAVKPGDQVTVTITNKDGFDHNFSISELKVNKDVPKGTTQSVTFTAGSSNLVYFCEYHRAKGMVGALNVGAANSIPSAPAGGATPAASPYSAY
ncbi:MAG: Cupredoxin-like domain [Chloroflexota bacterium]|jgi:plastocyanin|nr:Cupredoxin-like domain [Chloroflexota bacterium]